MSPDITQQIARHGMILPRAMPAHELRRFIASEIEWWRGIIRKAGIEAANSNCSGARSFCRMRGMNSVTPVP
jgi:hypothetical protein